jgi:hypothetical protein
MSDETDDLMMRQALVFLRLRRGVRCGCVEILG